jgi:hypothetical protein
MTATEDVRDGENVQGDLAALWEEASLEYYNLTKLKPSGKRFHSMEDILNDQEVQEKFTEVSNLASLII